MSKRPHSETQSTPNKPSCKVVDEYLEELRMYEARKRYNVALREGAACAAVTKPARSQTPESRKTHKKQVTFDGSWGEQLRAQHCRERRMDAAEEATWKARALTEKVAAQPCGEYRQ